MKNLILFGLLTFSLWVSIPLISQAGCTATRYCGSAGSLSCNGTSCTGSRPEVSNPWVKCDGVTSYCYGQPTP